MPGEDNGKRRVPPPPPSAAVTSVGTERRVPPPPPSSDVKKKDLSSQGSSTGLPPSQNTGQADQGSGTSVKIYHYKEKPENEYAIINNQWQRRKKGTTQWEVIHSPSAVSALNARHKKSVPVPASQAQLNMQQGLDLLQNSGKGIGTEEVQPLSGRGEYVSGEYVPSVQSILSPGKNQPYVSQMDIQNATDFAQNRKSDLQAAKEQELQYAQTPEQVAQVEQRYSSLISDQDRRIETAQLVPDTNKDILRAAPAPPQPGKLSIKKNPDPYVPKPRTVEDLASSNIIESQPSETFDPKAMDGPGVVNGPWFTFGAGTDAPSMPNEIVNPWDDPKSRDQINQYAEFSGRDLDEWRKVYGGGLSDEQFDELKKIQFDMRNVAYDLKMPETERAQKLQQMHSQIEDFLDQSKYINQKYYRANIEGKSLEDVLYEDKKEKGGKLIDDSNKFLYELVGSESAEVEKEVFDAENNMRDFLDDYYGVGQGTFRKDPETGNLVLEGFKSKEDEEYFNKKYNELYGAIKTAKGKRFEAINNTLVDLYGKKKRFETLLKNADEGDAAYIADQLKGINDNIKDLNNTKRGVLLTEPKELVKEITPYATDSFRASFSGLPKNLTPKQKFDIAYSQLYDRTMELKQKNGIAEDIPDEIGESLRDWLDWESLSVNLSPEEKEFYSNMKILSSLRPLYTNNDIGIMDENQGFWESFIGAATKSLFDETAVSSISEREKAAIQRQYLPKMGVSEGDLTDPKTIQKLEELGKEPDLASLEFAGNTVGVTAPLIADLLISKKISSSALSLLSKESSIASAVRTYDKTINSTRLGRYLKEPLEDAANAEIAGHLFGQEEELNFESFLLGGVGSKLIGSTIKKMGGEKALQYVASVFGDNADRAAKTFEKIGKSLSRGTAEVGEESIQELTQIYNDELRDRGFWDEVQNRFGNMDDISKFVVSSFVMGSAFGMVESNTAKQEYEKMPEEKRAIVDAIVSEAVSDVNKAENATANVINKMEHVEAVDKKIDKEPEPSLKGEVVNSPAVIDKSKVDIQSDETGETEYKIDDKFYSEPEISKMLDDDKFIEDVNNGSVALSVKNPSPEIQEKISPTPKVQDFEGIQEKTEGPGTKTEEKSSPGTAQQTVDNTDSMVENMTQQQFDDSAGRTDHEIIQQANDLDDGKTSSPEKKADEMIRKALDSLPEGQAPSSNQAVFDAVVEKAKEISRDTGLKGKKLMAELSSQIESYFDNKITKDDIADFQKEILDKIPKEVKVSGNSVETLTKDKFSAVSKAIRDKKFTSSMSDAMSQLKSSPIGVVTGVIDGAMEAVATTIDQAGTVAQAIDNGIKVIKDSDWYKNLSDNGKGAAEALFKKNVRGQIDNSLKASNTDAALQEIIDSISVDGKSISIDHAKTFDLIKQKAIDIYESTGLRDMKLIDELVKQLDEQFNGKIDKDDILYFRKEILSAIPFGIKDRSARKKPSKTNSNAENKSERGFAKKILDSTNIRDEIKEGLSEESRSYIPVSNNVTIEEADAIIESIGQEKAMMDVLNFNNNMEPRTRITMGMRLIESMNNSSSDEDNQNAVEIADQLSQYATQLGQGVQAFSIWSRLSPDNIEKSYNNKIKKEGSKFKRKNPNLFTGTKEGYDAGTGKAAKKATKKVLDSKIDQSKKIKAFGLDKDQIEQRKKDALAKIRKAGKGGPLTSGGINPELLEGLGEYGFALFADGVRTFKEWSIRMRYDTGIYDDDLLRSIWMDPSKTPAGKSMNDLAKSASIEDVVSDFFVKKYDSKKLSKKLQETFDLDKKTADDLANEISQEFDRIVKEERKAEIKKRTPRLTKKAQKAIDDIAGKDFMTKEEIEDKILHAFGLGNMSVETAAKLRDLAQERNKRPEGMLRDEVTHEILKTIAKEQGVKAGDVFWAVWYSSVLSGYETQILNIASNVMNIAMEGLVTTIDTAILKGDPRAIASSISGLVNGMKQGWREFEDVLSKGYSAERLRTKLEIDDTLELDLSNTKIGNKSFNANPLKFYKYVGRFMSAVDTAAYLAAKGARKQQVAREIAKEEGLSGEELRQRVSDLLNDTKQAEYEAVMRAGEEISQIDPKYFRRMSNRSLRRTINIRADEIISSKIDERVLQEAHNFAEFVTYRYDPQGVLGWAANGLSQAGQKFKPFKLVVPFTRIVANVLNQQIDYTPYGFMRAFGLNVSHWSRALDSTEAKDSRSRRRELIKATIGTLLMGGLYMLAASYADDEDPWFDITGKGPSDFNKRNQLLSQGWKPYHIKVGSTWMNYQSSPLGVALSFIGNWRDNEKYKELAEKEWMTKSAYALQSSASGIMDMSFLTGLSGLMAGLSSASNPENIQDRLVKATASTATSLIPNLFKQADRLYDPTVYDSKTVSAVLLKDVPIIRRYSGLRPTLNAFGQPVEKMGNRFFTVENPDPVWQFMAKNRVFAPGISQDVKLPDGTLMDDDQVYDYVKQSGKMVYDELKTNRDYYESLFSGLDTEQKQKIIQRLFRNARKAAKGAIFLKTLE